MKEGFASNFKNNEEPIEYLIKAIKASKLRSRKTCNDIFRCCGY